MSKELILVHKTFFSPVVWIQRYSSRFTEVGVDQDAPLGAVHWSHRDGFVSRICPVEVVLEPVQSQAHGGLQRWIHQRHLLGGVAGVVDESTAGKNEDIERWRKRRERGVALTAPRTPFQTNAFKCWPWSFPSKSSIFVKVDARVERYHVTKHDQEYQRVTEWWRVTVCVKWFSLPPAAVLRDCTGETVWCVCWGLDPNAMRRFSQGLACVYGGLLIGTDRLSLRSSPWMVMTWPQRRCEVRVKQPCSQTRISISVSPRYFFSFLSVSFRKGKRMWWLECTPQGCDGLWFYIGKH